MIKRVFIPAFITLILYSPQVFSESDTSSVIISRIDKEIIFDGLPFEKVWEEVEPLPVVMFQPDFGNEPTEKQRSVSFLTISICMFQEDFMIVMPQKSNLQQKKGMVLAETVTVSV